MPFLAARLLEVSWAAQAVQAAWRLRKSVQLWLERGRVTGVAGFLLMDAHEVFFMDFWMDFPTDRWVPSRNQPLLKVRGHNTNFGTSKHLWNFGSVNLYSLQTLVSHVCFFKWPIPRHWVGTTGISCSNMFQSFSHVSTRMNNLSWWMGRFNMRRLGRPIWNILKSTPD